MGDKRKGLANGETWKFCGILNHDYERRASGWREYFGVENGLTHKLDKCYCCGKPFADDEFLYAGFFLHGDSGFEMQFVCKECAYDISDKVTDYSIGEDGEVHVSEWKKECESCA